ncbi:cytochrome C oxidase subunit II [Piscibacillus sp. B03]|uniref:cytochrome C oxidase subunit II n=1 Tax=Piscibacillus sp. B03 TaxID=3457430 RepID=UPI003FCCF6BF
MKKLMLMLLGSMILLAACGGDNDSSGEVEQVEASEKVTLEASNFDFNQDTYEVNSGDIEIELVNVEGMHGITIDGVDGFELKDAGSQTVHLDPGEYTVRCSVPCGQGHMDMVATIVVN